MKKISTVYALTVPVSTMKSPVVFHNRDQICKTETQVRTKKFKSNLANGKPEASKALKFVIPFLNEFIMK